MEQYALPMFIVFFREPFECGGLSKVRAAARSVLWAPAPVLLRTELDEHKDCAATDLEDAGVRSAGVPVWI